MASVIYTQKIIAENPVIFYEFILLGLLLVLTTTTVIFLFVIKNRFDQRDPTHKLLGGIKNIEAECHANSKLLKKIEARVKKAEKEINNQSQIITDNKYDFLKSLNDLKVETIDAQTAKFKINEAIRKAMRD